MDEVGKLILARLSLSGYVLGVEDTVPITIRVTQEIADRLDALAKSGIVESTRTQATRVCVEAGLDKLAPKKRKR